MPPKSKKRHFWPRVLSLFSGRRSAVDDPHQVANAGAGPSQSDHPSARSAPNLPLPAGSSTPRYHEPPPPIHHSRNESEVLDHLHRTPLSIPQNIDLLRPQQPFPTLHSYDQPIGPRSHSGARCFLSGASGFQMGDIQYIEASNVTVHNGGSARESSIDGTSIPPRGYTHLCSNA